MYRAHHLCIGISGVLKVKVAVWGPLKYGGLKAVGRVNWERRGGWNEVRTFKRTFRETDFEAKPLFPCLELLT